MNRKPVLVFNRTYGQRDVPRDCLCQCLRHTALQPMFFCPREDLPAFCLKWLMWQFNPNAYLNDVRVHRQILRVIVDFNTMFWFGCECDGGSTTDVTDAWQWWQSSSLRWINYTTARSFIEWMTDWKHNCNQELSFKSGEVKEVFSMCRGCAKLCIWCYQNIAAWIKLSHAQELFIELYRLQRVWAADFVGCSILQSLTSVFEIHGAWALRRSSAVSPQTHGSSSSVLLHAEEWNRKMR